MDLLDRKHIYDGFREFIRNDEFRYIADPEGSYRWATRVQQMKRKNYNAPSNYMAARDIYFMLTGMTIRSTTELVYYTNVMVMRFLTVYVRHCITVMVEKGIIKNIFKTLAFWYRDILKKPTKKRLEMIYSYLDMSKLKDRSDEALLYMPFDHVHRLLNAIFGSFDEQVTLFSITDSAHTLALYRSFDDFWNTKRWTQYPQLLLPGEVFKPEGVNYKPLLWRDDNPEDPGDRGEKDYFTLLRASPEQIKNDLKTLNAKQAYVKKMLCFFLVRKSTIHNTIISPSEFFDQSDFNLRKNSDWLLSLSAGWTMQRLMVPKEIDDAAFFLKWCLRFPMDTDYGWEQEKFGQAWAERLELDDMINDYVFINTGKMVQDTQKLLDLKKLFLLIYCYSFFYATFIEVGKGYNRGRPRDYFDYVLDGQPNSAGHFVLAESYQELSDYVRTAVAMRSGYIESIQREEPNMIRVFQAFYYQTNLKNSTKRTGQLSQKLSLMNFLENENILEPQFSTGYFTIAYPKLSPVHTTQIERRYSEVSSYTDIEDALIIARHQMENALTMEPLFIEEIKTEREKDKMRPLLKNASTTIVWAIFYRLSTTIFSDRKNIFAYMHSNSFYQPPGFHSDSASSSSSSVRSRPFLFMNNQLEEYMEKYARLDELTVVLTKKNN